MNNGRAVTPVASLQGALDIIEARRWKGVPSTYRKYFGAISPGDLDKLLAELRDVDNRANYPVLVARDYDGSNWLLGFGDCERAGKIVKVVITTDHVHASEIRGDALDDAECYVAVRNNLPRIIAALEELLEQRLSSVSTGGGPR